MKSKLATLLLLFTLSISTFSTARAGLVTGNAFLAAWAVGMVAGVTGLICQDTNSCTDKTETIAKKTFFAAWIVGFVGGILEENGATVKMKKLTVELADQIGATDAERLAYNDSLEEIAEIINTAQSMKIDGANDEDILAEVNLMKSDLPKEAFGAYNKLIQLSSTPK